MDDNILEVILQAQDNISKTLKGVNGKLDQLDKTAQATGTGGVSGLNTKMIALGTTIGNLAAKGLIALGRGVLAVGKSMISTTAQFEQSEIAFKTLLKTTEATDEALNRIKESAKATPFELPGLIKMNQLLISAGIGAEDANKAILDLGDAISATGGGQAEMDRMVINLQQIQNAGKATAMDIKQFTAAGIPIYNLLAEATGKSVAELKEMDVTYEDITNALDLANDAGGIFHDAMINQSKSLNGIISNVKDTLGIMGLELMMNSGAFDFIKDKAGAFLGILEKLQPIALELIQFLKTGDITGGLLDALGIFEDSPIVDKLMAFRETLVKVKTKLQDFVSFVKDKVGAVWQKLKDDPDLAKSVLAGFAGMVTAILIPALVGLATTLGGVAIATASALAPLLLIGIAVGGLVLLFKKNEKFRNFITEAFEKIKIWSAIAWEKLKIFGAWIQNTLVPIIVDAWDNKIKPAFVTFGEIVKTLWEDNIKPALESLVEYWQTTLGPVIQDVWENNIKPALDNLKVAWEAIWPVIKKVGEIFFTVVGVIVAVVVGVLWAALKPVVLWLIDFFKVAIPIAIKAFGVAFEVVSVVIKWVAEKIKTRFENMKAGIKLAIAGAKIIIGELKTKFENVKNKIVTIKDNIVTAFSNMKTNITTYIDNIKTKISELVTDFKTAAATIPGFGEGGIFSLFNAANGADFIVPPGFPNDSFPMGVQSGEHVQVTPASQVNNTNNNNQKTTTIGDVIFNNNMEFDSFMSEIDYLMQ